MVLLLKDSLIYYITNKLALEFVNVRILNIPKRPRMENGSLLITETYVIGFILILSGLRLLRKARNYILQGNAIILVSLSTRE